MPRKERKPKDLLADRELIGFARRDGDDDRVVERASSAKVLAKGALRDKPEKPVAPPDKD